MFYVYSYINPEIEGPFKYLNYEFKHQPFYIGKGTGSRAQAHLYKKDSSAYPRAWELIRKGYKDTDIIHIVDEDITEAEALIIESALIKEIGTIERGGSLYNILEGQSPPANWKNQNSKTPKIVFTFRVKQAEEQKWQELYKQFQSNGGDAKVSYREFIYNATKLGIEQFNVNEKYPRIIFRLQSKYYEQLKQMLNGDADKINIKARELLIQSLESPGYADFKRTLATLLKTNEGQEVLRQIVDSIEKEQ